MRTNKGTFVVDEQIYPVTDIYLNMGQFVIQVLLDPAPKPGTRGYALYDRNGAIVFRNPEWECPWPTSGRVVLDLGLTMHGMDGTIRHAGMTTSTMTDAG